MAQHWHCNFGVSPMDTRQEAKQPLKSASFGREKLHHRTSFGPCSLLVVLEHGQYIFPFTWEFHNPN